MAADVEWAPFGERLRRLRVAAGLSQEALAERAGLSTQAIGALETGKRRRPYPHTVAALAEALDLSGRSEPRWPRRGGPACRRAAPSPCTPLSRSPLNASVGREEDCGRSWNACAPERTAC